MLHPLYTITIYGVIENIVIMKLFDLKMLKVNKFSITCVYICMQIFKIQYTLGVS